MRTETVKIYTIDELTDESKETAHENYLNSDSFEYHNLDELIETMKAFANVFPVKITDYSLGSDYADVSFEMVCDDDIENLSGIRLAKYIWNNYKTDLYKGKYFHKNGKSRHSKIILDNDCVLTGVCFDWDILKPLFDFMAKPCKYTDFSDLMKECFAAFETCVKNELESEQSFEYFVEHASINEYEFTSDGERYF